MKETWLPIKGYEGRYEVSNKGEVRSVSRSVRIFNGTRVMRGRVLKPGITNAGYKYVNLLFDGEATSITVHRLVARTFIPNKENKPCIDHINGDRLDNRVENLRWCSYKENQNYDTAKLRRKSLNVKVRQLGLDGTLIKTFDSIRDAENETGVFHSNIIANCRGRRNNAGGYKWSY